MPGLLDHRVAPGAGLLVAGAGEKGDRSRLRGQRGVDGAHVVETVMGDVLAQQGEGNRVGLQSQHAGVREAMLEIVGGHADVRAGIDDQRRATASVEHVLVTVEDVMADALELLEVPAEEPVSPAVDDRSPLGGVAHDPTVSHTAAIRLPSGPSTASSPVVTAMSRREG